MPRPDPMTGPPNGDRREDEPRAATARGTDPHGPEDAPAASGPPAPGRASPSERDRRELVSLMTSRVRDVYLRKPFFVDGATDLVTICLGILAVLLGIAFEKQNIAFMVSLAFAVAASANFPVLFMSVLWKDCTTKGAVIGGFLGLLSSVLLTVLSPSVWEATLGNPAGSAPFPYTSPALFSMTLGFVGIWLFSILDNSQRAKIDRAGYPAQQVRSETGIGAAEASGH